MKLAKVLERPTIFVSYSLGGVITRAIINTCLDEQERKNVKAILFLASPLNGSDTGDQIRNDLRPFIGPFLPFKDSFGNSISPHEFVDHFYEAGFPLSNVTKTVDSNKDHE